MPQCPLKIAKNKNILRFPIFLDDVSDACYQVVVGRVVGRWLCWLGFHVRLRPSAIRKLPKQHILTF